MNNDGLTLNQLAERNAVLVSEVEKLRTEREQLAAENVGLKEYRPEPYGIAMMEALDAFFADEEVPERAMMAAFEILCAKRMPSPTTDRIVAEAEARGVEKAIECIVQTITPNHETVLKEFAAQLREGAK
ncbi:hypothetical protein [Raoultella ornithinolytica]|uniref:hypothetical protein n=1 Tax=Raoultella ornithinolytica TaxID=54291 RepID=UPI000CF353BA|nr:hypothetical protein [Raoultella ornithinolytica]PQH13454.1 hypothetical protein C5T92_19300 [Raoultella ornithinolytica]PQH35697.1 hypothetical protein C5T94_20300 [Raoultella ornithinolytica]